MTGDRYTREKIAALLEGVPVMPGWTVTTDLDHIAHAARLLSESGHEALTAALVAAMEET